MLAGLGGIVSAIETEAQTSDTITQADIDTTFASEEFNYLLQNFYYEPERLGLSENQVSQANIGKPFTIARISGNSIEKNNSVEHFPIYSSNEIIALLTITKLKNGTTSSSISKAYSSEIQDYLNAQTSNIALFSDESNLYGINNNSKVSILFNFKNSGATTYSINQSEINFEDVNMGNNIISKENLTAIRSVVPEFSRGIIHVGDDWYLANYPGIKQTTGMGCWATCIATMARFELPGTYSTLTEQNVINTMQCYNGATPAQTLAALNQYFTYPYIPTQISTPLDESWIESITNNVDPVLMFLADDLWENAHQTVLVGYRNYVGTTNMYTTWIMDPALGYVVLNQYNSNIGQTYTDYTNSTRHYTWERSFVFYYNI